MKLTIDIPIELYERMENALSSKTMKEALNDPVVMVGWHVVSARYAQHRVQSDGAYCDCKTPMFEDGVNCSRCGRKESPRR